MTRLDSGRGQLPSGWEVERRRFSALWQSYLTRQLNQIFSLSSAGSGRRRLQTLFSVLVFAVAAFGAHVALQLQLRSFAGPVMDLADLMPVAFIAGLRIILIVGIAASIGLHIAGRFLADSRAGARWHHRDRGRLQRRRCSRRRRHHQEHRHQPRD